jgi:serine/threonine-protein kinase
VDEQGDITTKAVSPLIGTKLGGQYTVMAMIGEGGMGMIYRARQDIVDREVAIKFLPQALAQDEINVQRLAREAKALGRLTHANIVTTFDFGFTDKHEPYLVFEFVDGESLQVYLARRGCLPPVECVPMFIQLADAMKYAHANGVVHRDIKPHNIMVIEKDGKTIVKILDFGIAQMKSESQKLTRAGEIWGSPNYMSPEQCVGDPVDHLTDIYSLGVVMYRTLSGVVPNTGKSFADTVSKKLNSPVPFFGSLELEKPVEVPEGLEEIVIKCLRRHTDERIQSMADLKTALVAFAQQANIPDGSVSLSYGENIQSDKAAKTLSVTRPNTLHKPDKASHNSRSATTSKQNRSTASAAKSGAQSKFAPFKLPLIALLSVVLACAVTGAMCFLLGEKREETTKDSAPAATTTPIRAKARSGNPVAPFSPVAPVAPVAPGVQVIEKASPKTLEKMPEQPAKKALPLTPEQKPEENTKINPVQQSNQPTAQEKAKPPVSALPDKAATEAKPAHREHHRSHSSATASQRGAARRSEEDSAPPARNMFHFREGDQNQYYRDFGGARESH